MKKRMSSFGVILVVAACLAAPPMAMASPPRSGVPDQDGWELLRSEKFSKPLSAKDDTGWFANKDEAGTDYDVDAYDNDGEFFKTFGGQEFEQGLAGMALYRRSYSFGEDGWLTAELAARDTDNDGRPNKLPSFGRATVPGAGPVGRFEVPSHNSGVVLRSTEALPEKYRIEVTLKTLDFGGKRDGSWHYDGKINGYEPSECSTNFPWSGSPKWDYSRPECEWADVTKDANGYYFLSIMDFDRPAPHNNTFVHQRRKVVMDGYNRYNLTGDGLRYCDPRSGDLKPYEWGSGNGVNMLFMTPFRRYSSAPGTEYLMKSECGTTFGGGIVSQVDLVPEMMPKSDYRFAVERLDDSYVLEIEGFFRNVGWARYRYEQPFDDGIHPIYHYNQSSDDYDGRYNDDWTYGDGEKQFTDRDIWPKGSSYPDYFMMGIPHMNFYEGSASIDGVKLFVPSGEAAE